MPVGEICNRDVIVVDKAATVLDIAKTMREYHVGDVIVVEQRDGERIPVGIVTDRDLVVEVMAQEVDMGSVTAGDIMSTDLLTAQEQDEILNTIKRMRMRGVRRLPVVNFRGGLEGVVTVDDVMELIAEEANELVKLVSREQRRETRQRA